METLLSNDILLTVKQVVEWLWAQAEVQVIVLHVVLNLALAVAATIKTGTFVLAKTGEFLYKKLLPLVIVYGVLAFVVQSLGYGELKLAVFAAIETGLLGDMLDNLGKLGLKLPDALTKVRL